MTEKIWIKQPAGYLPANADNSFYNSRISGKQKLFSRYAHKWIVITLQ